MRRGMDSLLLKEEIHLPVLDGQIEQAVTVGVAHLDIGACLYQDPGCFQIPVSHYRNK